MSSIIVTGSWAERMSFEAFLIFVIVWPFLVYYPLAHWVWNMDGFLNNLGVLDFAGGLTIHTSSGTAALAVTSVIPSRLKSSLKVGLSHHNLALFFLGGSLSLWAGWYSFNGGSAFRANEQAAQALLNTHLSCIMWCFSMDYIILYKRKKYSILAVMNGAFCGLAAITPSEWFCT